MIPIDPDGASAFGTSVDISGDTAVIGATGGVVGKDVVGAAYIFTQNEPPFWNQHTKLVAGDRRGGDQLGFAVAISGNEVIAGAPKHSAGGLASGAAYIFEQKEDGAWVESIKLSDGETASEDQFGISVSISGNLAIAGAQQDDYIAPNAGAAYIFERSGTLWLQRAKLSADDAKAGDLFGNAVAISDETVVIGAPGVDDAGPEAGAVYIFQRSDTEWIQQAKLIANDISMFDRFGTAIALHQNTAIIGAHGKDEASVDAGAAYIFVRNGVSWTQQANSHIKTLYQGISLVVLWLSTAIMRSLVHTGVTQQDPTPVPHTSLPAMVGHGAKTSNLSQTTVDSATNSATL